MGSSLRETDCIPENVPSRERLRQVAVTLRKFAKNQKKYFFWAFYSIVIVFRHRKMLNFKFLNVCFYFGTFNISLKYFNFNNWYRFIEFSGFSIPLLTVSMSIPLLIFQKAVCPLPRTKFRILPVYRPLSFLKIDYWSGGWCRTRRSCTRWDLRDGRNSHFDEKRRNCVLRFFSCWKIHPSDILWSTLLSLYFFH